MGPAPGLGAGLGEAARRCCCHRSNLVVVPCHHGQPLDGCQLDSYSQTQLQLSTTSPRHLDTHIQNTKHKKKHGMRSIERAREHDIATPASATACASAVREACLIALWTAQTLYLRRRDWLSNDFHGVLFSIFILPFLPSTIIITITKPYSSAGFFLFFFSYHLLVHYFTYDIRRGWSAIDTGGSTRGEKKSSGSQD